MDDWFGIDRFGIAFAFRLVNAFVSTAYFQADEFYQSWEVAYSDTYGAGFRSWEWQAAIRTSLVPHLFSMLMKASEVLRMDYLVLGKVLMAAVAAVADVYSAAVADLLFPGTGSSAFLLSLFSMFNFYVSTRPFSNTFEMVLITVALFYWVRSRGLTDLVRAQVLAQIAIALRPNGGIFWLVLAADLLYSTPRWLAKVKIVVVSVLVAAVVQGGIAWLDALYYTQTSLPLVEFAKYNFGSRISEIYGVMPWHWYFSQGLPFLLLGYIPFFLAGWSQATFKWRLLLVINLICFSIIPHKEFRFIYFLLPILHAIAALGLPRVPRWLRRLACGLNLVVGIYLGHFHQKGVVDVVDFIRHTPAVHDVSFLMPCHSTPWHAHFQRHSDPLFQPRFLTCEPPWNVSSTAYVDEADQFYLDPAQFLVDHPEWLASKVVVFETIKPLMEANGYVEERAFFNGLFNEDKRRRGKVLLMQKSKIHEQMRETETPEQSTEVTYIRETRQATTKHTNKNTQTK